MPFIQTDIIGVEGLDKPHLALLTDKSGEATAIPVGATMFIVMDPDRADGVVPLILAKVSLKKLVFRCGCRNPQCSKVLELPAIWKGHHPQSAVHAKPTDA